MRKKSVVKIDSMKVRHRMLDMRMTNKRLHELTGISAGRISNILNDRPTTVLYVWKIAEALGFECTDILLIDGKKI